ncbi:MAG: bifunctional DNA-formamidopyrimidine glycosylase/DNA-(apurinic or apyrimidinic site) lyase [Firmicutes bacterium]|nr:bifunctional DNA-formamidopyrimidine glycosylase/DNA-(apurinic or apyrimidinic site) lyase [Bacillota bacterium]
MPELPEIETVKRTLSPLLCGKSFTDCTLFNETVIKHPQPALFARRIIGRQIREISRRGKYLLLHLDDGAVLAAHLRMTGRLLYAPADRPLKPHTHVVCALSDGCRLCYTDVRRFGRLWLIEPGETDDFTGMSALGIEPLSPEFGPEYLQSALGKRSAAVKQGLLDQHVLAGLGNIYADESLFAAGICPCRGANSLNEEEWRRLAAAIPPVLQAAIEHNGTTFRDYVDGEGKEGENLPFLQAYSRAGQPCFRCGTPLLKIKVGGRGTVYCPHCQK